MKKNDCDWLFKFLEDYDEYLGRKCCNDLEMKNTAENWQLYVEACAWNVHKTVEDYKENDPEYTPRPRDSRIIVVSDFLIFGYLKHKLKLFLASLHEEVN